MQNVPLNAPIEVSEYCQVGLNSRSDPRMPLKGIKIIKYILCITFLNCDRLIDLWVAEVAKYDFRSSLRTSQMPSTERGALR